MIGSELPKGWDIQPLKEVVTSTKGKKPKQLSELPFDNSIPYIDIKALEKDLIEQYADVESSKSFSPNDIAVVWDGARCGWVSKSKEGAIGSTICALTPKNNIESNYLYYFLLEKYPIVNSKGRGVGIPHVDPTFFWDMEVPIPSPKEQKQIAEKLDKFFDQIETIKEASNKIPEFLKNFRQQVLTYAVTGKLIESTPEPRMLGELIDELKYGTSKKADYDIEGFPVLRIPNINNGEIDSSDLKYVPLDDKEYNQLSLQEGDILVIRSNGSLSIVGQCAIVRKECENWVYAGYLIRIRCTHELLPEYLNYIFQSYQVRKQIVEKSHSMSGVNNFSADKIKQLKIAWYPVEVQKQIVDKLNSIFGKLNEIEKQYNTLCEKLDKLPQTLLCKAFKGELIYERFT